MKLWVIYNKKHENTFVPQSMKNAATKNGIDCRVFFFEYFSYLVKNGTLKLYYKSKEVKTFPDVAFIRGYDKTLHEFLANKGVKFVNSQDGEFTTLDKFKMHCAVSKLNILQPKTLCGDYDFAEIKKQLNVPFVMKNRYGARGENVFLIDSEMMFNGIKNNNQNIEFIFQEYVKESRGMDIRLYVVGDNVIGSIKRMSVNGDFRSNIATGGTSESFSKIPKKIIRIAEKLAKTLDLHFFSVDFLLANDKYIFCEANANAGFGAFIKCGFNMHDLIMEYIKTIN